jgi:hypothetical protein
VATTCVLGRLGRRDEAAAAYRKALELVGNDPERDFLRLRLAELADWRSARSVGDDAVLVLGQQQLGQLGELPPVGGLGKGPDYVVARPASPTGPTGPGHHRRVATAVGTGKTFANCEAGEVAVGGSAIALN